MKLIVGLGNPGRKYQNTRHNIGFMAVDHLVDRHDASFSAQKKLFAEAARITGENETTVILKPQTYMNESGQAVRATCDFYDIDASNILIVYDELALPLGTIRTRFGGEAAGHNGIKSIIAHCGREFYRLRIGISNQYADTQSSESFVLSPFAKKERETIDTILETADDYMESFMRDELESSTSEVN